MEKNLEQRYAVKFCVRLGKNGVETVEMIRQAYGDKAMSKAQVCRWHKAFKEGREEVADEPRSGRPSTSRTDDNVSRVRECLNKDRRLSVRLVADMLNLPKTLVHDIVTGEMQMRKVCAKLVPKILTDEQRELRVQRSQELLDLIENDPDFLNSVVTGDESWIFEYDPESKRQSSEWHTSESPRPKKARMSKSRVKTMLIVFFDVRGIVHHEFLPQGQTVNSQFYLEVLKRLKQRVNRSRSNIKNVWKLHHDNAPSHSAFLIGDYLARTGVSVVPQPPYSPDLAPSDFFLFPRIKNVFKGKHLDNVDNIQAVTTACLKDLTSDVFLGAFQAWKHRLQKCIDANGAYFEEF